MNRTLIAVSLAAAALFSTTASAGEFEVSYQHVKGNQTMVIVSFAGDKSTVDAQLDLDLPEGMSVVRADAKVAGSVCVGLADQKLLRVVPPSGAETPLTSKATHYCSFLLKGKLGANAFKAARTNECSSLKSGVAACGLAVENVSDK